MADVRSITNPVINKISKAEFDVKVAAGVITPTMIEDEVWINQDVTIEDQEKLRNLKAVATSGSYNDLTDKPTIPTKTSELSNDSGFITSASLPTKTSDLTNDSGFITGYTESDPTVPAWAKASTKPSYAYNEITGKPTLSTVATSGSYNDLTDKPTIPSVAGFASTSYVDTKVANLVNSAPTTLDTLGELATALQNNQSVVNSAIGNKADKTELFSGSYNDLTNKPTLFSGNYNDLTNKPTLSTCTLKIWG